jgi:hypothetical protein
MLIQEYLAVLLQRVDKLALAPGVCMNVEKVSGCIHLT